MERLARGCEMIGMFVELMAGHRPGRQIVALVQCRLETPVDLEIALSKMRLQRGDRIEPADQRLGSIVKQFAQRLTRR